MRWFERLTGIVESSGEQVRHALTLVDETIITPDGRQLVCGSLETASVAELRRMVGDAESRSSRSTIREVVADVRRLYVDPANEHALFQVASQFNLLEMISPQVTPDDGISDYELDRTQGPTCAICCGAGTIYRNYFVELDGQRGQTADRQIDCASDLGELLGNVGDRLWQMQNGYLFASARGLEEVSQRLASADEAMLDRYRRALRIGLQWRTGVTIDDCEHLVSQAYCSAVPVAYSDHPPNAWEPFARLVLEAAYEATFCAAAINQARHGSSKLFLTLLGGGVFGNRGDWILDAIARAFRQHRDSGLDVAVVSYGRSNPDVVELARQLDSLDGPPDNLLHL